MTKPDLPLAALKRAGCERKFADRAGGETTTCPELTKCLKPLNAADVLTGWNLDLIGRCLRDLIRLLDYLKAGGIAFQALTEAVDTAAPLGGAMWRMVEMLAELARSLIEEQTTTGRAAAKARGVKMGCKPFLSAQQLAHARKPIGMGDPDAVASSLKLS